MNKITNFKWLIILLALGFTNVFAQNPYKFLKVDFVGAMDQNDWTKGWTNWNPEQTDYPSVNETSTLNAASTPSGKIEITGNITLDASKVYLLTGIIYIKNGGVLDIPAGTTIRAEGDPSASPANWSTIVVQRGGKIYVNGTKEMPVVFTSNKAKGSRKPGDWGGIILLGRALNNQPGGQAGCTQCTKGEALIEGPFGYPDAVHGGSDDADNSGSIQYTRIEFPGLVFSANNEINGLTLGSVGYNTLLRSIQVSFSNDDSYEWFGGTVNSRYLVAFKGTDDDFDTDFGYRGMNQFGIGFKDSLHFDPTWNAVTGASTSEGFESDNDATGTTNRPKTAAVFSNYTMVGPYAEGETFSQHSSTVKGAYRRGARIRRNSALSITNSIFMGYRNGIMIDGAASETNVNVTAGPTDSDTSFVRYNILTGLLASPTATATGLVEVASGRDTGLVSKWLRASYNRISPAMWAKNSLLVDPNNYLNPDFRPVNSSVAMTGANFSNAKNSNFELGLKQAGLLGSVILYPNPSNGSSSLELNLLNRAALQISLLTVDGREIRTIKDTFNSGKSTVTLDHLDQGIYMVRVSGDGSLNTFKLIVK